MSKFVPSLWLGERLPDRKTLMGLGWISTDSDRIRSERMLADLDRILRESCGPTQYHYQSWVGRLVLTGKLVAGQMARWVPG
jgi:hypothetical protein